MEFQAASVPAEMKGLRACITCMLVKTFSQFYDEGCDNCTFLQLKDDRSLVAEATTESFRGMTSIMDPKKSWVSRWLRVCKLIGLLTFFSKSSTWVLCHENRCSIK